MKAPALSKYHWFNQIFSLRGRSSSEEKNTVVEKGPFNSRMSFGGMKFLKDARAFDQGSVESDFG